MKATAHKKPSDGSLEAALLHITSCVSGGRCRNTFHNSPRQPGPSPSPSEPAMRAGGRRRQPPLLAPGPARHGALPSPCGPGGQPTPLRPGCHRSRPVEEAAGPGNMNTSPPSPPPAPHTVDELGQQSARTKVKNKQIATSAAAAAIGLWKIIQALWGRRY